MNDGNFQVSNIIFSRHLQLCVNVFPSVAVCCTLWNCDSRAFPVANVIKKRSLRQVVFIQLQFALSPLDATKTYTLLFQVKELAGLCLTVVTTRGQNSVSFPFSTSAKPYCIYVMWFCREKIDQNNLGFGNIQALMMNTLL